MDITEKAGVLLITVLYDRTTVSGRLVIMYIVATEHLLCYL